MRRRRARPQAAIVAERPEPQRIDPGEGLQPLVARPEVMKRHEAHGKVVRQQPALVLRVEAAVLFEKLEKEAHGGGRSPTSPWS